MMNLYDNTNIDQLVWPETKEGELAKKHLLPLIKEGPETFIQNAKTKLSILSFDGLIVPISVNEGEYENCYLLSSYFVAAHFQEKLDQKKNWVSFCQRPFATLFSSFLKFMKINKVVIINNWMLTTNPYPDLTSVQIGKIRAFLTTRFRDHYFMFRSINTYKSSTTFDALYREHFRMIPCRHVYLYDPSRKTELPSSTIRKQKKDTNRIQNKKYEVEVANSLTKEEINRLLELYSSVYIGRYTRYSPLYTEKYLLNVLENETIRLKLLKKDGKIFGVTGFMQKNDYLLVPFFGYDTTVPQEEGLYRMLSSVILSEIEKVNLVSHQGSGAGQFKKWRGFMEHLEYIGIYDRHLPIYRRLFWSASQKFSPLFLKKRKPHDEQLA